MAHWGHDHTIHPYTVLQPLRGFWPFSKGASIFSTPTSSPPTAYSSSLYQSLPRQLRGFLCISCSRGDVSALCPTPNLEDQSTPFRLGHSLESVRHGRPCQRLRYNLHCSHDPLTTQAPSTTLRWGTNMAFRVSALIVFPLYRPVLAHTVTHLSR